MDDIFEDFIDEEDSQQKEKHRRGSYGSFSEEEDDY